MRHSQPLTECIRWACLAEVHSRKPGNVSPESSFHDVALTDFSRSAEAIALPLSRCASRPLGVSILDAARATRAVVDSNTNLGIILLFAPLCAAELPLTTESVANILAGTTVEDAVATYAAIDVMQPSGLGEVDDQDLSSRPTQNLLQCMHLAKDRDQIAAEYCNSFSMVLGEGQAFLSESLQQYPADPLSLVALRMIATHGDSLIRRKCGDHVELQAKQKARQVLKSGWPESTESQQAWDEFDQWLRSDGNRRNPGTTADLIAAVVLAALRNQKIRMSDEFVPVVGV